ncbi:hypothetical protein GIB67_017887 [Kingdonia uniflora]|uniref:3-hydroxyisobutyryl-CoA hydrolase n=1 Tax=Kingdonia uniflora TaxID=39325 RepID=A0A7J7ML36_9MAGN|nr:hypothetical protein GIB67_017887 [Kingdonia uniflora]
MAILTAAGYKVFPYEPEDTKTEILDASNCHKSASHLPHVLLSEPAPPGEHIDSSSSVAQPQEVFSLQSIESMLQTVMTRLDAIEGRLRTIEGRLETIETDVRGLRPVQEPVSWLSQLKTLTNEDHWTKDADMCKYTLLIFLIYLKTFEIKMLLIVKALKFYKNDSSTKMVVLKGNGKAFCAGGDAALVVRNSSITGHWTYGCSFYRKQLIMDYTIAMPIFAFFDCVQIFAMPETALGLFPDVGASHFLSKLPGFFGEYVGLTGARLDGAEMLACGLATHFVHSKNLSFLEEAFLSIDSTDETIVSNVIDKFADITSVMPESPYRSLDIINKCFSKNTVEEILSSLENEYIGKEVKWISAAIRSLKTASPLGLKIFLRSIREGRTQDLKQCLVREYRLSSHVLRRTISNDFYEGCRALLIDKDKKPKWEPSKLELVSNEMVNKYFEKVDDEDWEELELPTYKISRAKMALCAYKYYGAVK